MISHCLALVIAVLNNCQINSDNNDMNAHSLVAL